MMEHASWIWFWPEYPILQLVRLVSRLLGLQIGIPSSWISRDSGQKRWLSSQPQLVQLECTRRESYCRFQHQSNAINSNPRNFVCKMDSRSGTDCCSTQRSKKVQTIPRLHHRGPPPYLGHILRRKAHRQSL